MLDYYFCEECQTYHQPNRLINGEILSACECSISTQPSFDQTNPNIRNSGVKPIHQHTPFKQNTIHIPGDQRMGEGSYESPRIQKTAVFAHPRPDPGRKFENMPFISIIDQENRERMRKILISPQSRQPNPPVFLSPRKIKEEVTIRKPVNPLPGSSRKIITVSPKKRLLSPPPPIRRVLPIQQVAPIVVLNQTPIKTFDRLTVSQQPETRINTLVTTSYPQDQFQPPSIKIINNENSKRALKVEYNQNRVTLDRVKGERYAEEYSEENQYKDKRVSLDRVTEDKNVVYESEQKITCCGSL